METAVLTVLLKAQNKILHKVKLHIFYINKYHICSDSFSFTGLFELRYQQSSDSLEL